MKKISYAQLKKEFIKFNNKNEITAKGSKNYIVGVIVFTEDSFNKWYPLEARSYKLTSDNKAFISNCGGYSIFAGSLDKSDPFVRLENYMVEERGGSNGWKVAYCYLVED